MAHNHLPAVLRRRRHLLRLRHGADARHPHPQDLRPGRFHHRAPPAEFREGHAGDGTDCRLRLRYRGIHGLVQRRSLRRLHALESPPRPLCSPLLDAVDLQHLYSAGALDSQAAHESRCTVFVSGVILVGMWLERFIIVVVSLQRDFLTSSWGMYYPTRWDWMTYI